MRKVEKNHTHFELTNDFVSESVWLAELQLCRSESCRDTGLNDDVKDKLYPYALQIIACTKIISCCVWWWNVDGVVSVVSVSGIVVVGQQKASEKTQNKK